MVQSRRFFAVFSTFFVGGLLAFASLLLILFMTLGHFAGDQVRREKVRQQLMRVYRAQAVTFPSFDGTMLAGLLIQRQAAKGTVILCHGYRRSKEQMARFVRLFDGYNIFLFDFRGAGESGGFFSTLGYHESNDVKAAIGYLHQSLPADEFRPLILFGVSMGAAAVLKAAAEMPAGIDALILDSAYAKLQNLVDESAQHFSQVPYWLVSWSACFVQALLGPFLSMNPEESCKHVAVPSFFIHSATDSITSPLHSVRLCGRMQLRGKALATIWLTPPAKHALSYLAYPYEYARRVHRFLEVAGC